MTLFINHLYLYIFLVYFKSPYIIKNHITFAYYTLWVVKKLKQKLTSILHIHIHTANAMPMHLYIKGNYSWKPRILSFLAIFLKKISILCSGWNILVGTLKVKWNGNLKVEMLRAFSLLVWSNIFVCVKSGEHWVMTRVLNFHIDTMDVLLWMHKLDWRR